jgi:hypothetical protein
MRSQSFEDIVATNLDVKGTTGSFLRFNIPGIQGQDQDFTLSNITGTGLERSGRHQRAEDARSCSGTVYPAQTALINALSPQLK